MGCFRILLRVVQLILIVTLIYSIHHYQTVDNCQKAELEQEPQFMAHRRYLIKQRFAHETAIADIFGKSYWEVRELLDFQFTSNIFPMLILLKDEKYRVDLGVNSAYLMTKEESHRQDHYSALINNCRYVAIAYDKLPKETIDLLRYSNNSLRTLDWCLKTSINNKQLLFERDLMLIENLLYKVTELIKNIPKNVGIYKDYDDYYDDRRRSSDDRSNDHDDEEDEQVERVEQQPKRVRKILYENELDSMKQHKMEQLTGSDQLPEDDKAGYDEEAEEDAENDALNYVEPDEP